MQAADVEQRNRLVPRTKEKKITENAWKKPRMTLQKDGIRHLELALAGDLVCLE